MRLVIEDAGGTRSVVPFTSDDITVGRAAEGNSVRLSERDVSRRHARFFRLNGAEFVEDLGSLTGTRVNGERITGRRRLREGDLVEIGDYDLALLPDEPGAPPPIPPGARTPDPRPPAARTTPPPSAPPPATAPAVAPSEPAPLAAPPDPAARAPEAAPQPEPPRSPAAPAAPAPLAVAPSPAVAEAADAARAQTLRVAVAAGAVALLLGLGAGWLAGALTAPPPAAPGASSR